MYTILTKNEYASLDRYHPNQSTFDKDFYDKNVPLESSRNPNFNKILYQFGSSILDIGCGGGQFILDCVNDGYEAIGIDGLYAYQKYKVAAWNLLPNNLFCADITEPFQILKNDENMKFDIITSWEFMEHLFESDIDRVIGNITRHLKDTGVYICSISNRPCDGHFTIKPTDWWIKQFQKFGLYPNDIITKFNGQFVRMLDDSMYFSFSFKM